MKGETIPFLLFLVYLLVVVSYAVIIMIYHIGRVILFTAWRFLLPQNWYEKNLDTLKKRLLNTPKTTIYHYDEPYDSIGASHGWVGGYEGGHAYNGPPYEGASMTTDIPNPDCEKIQIKIAMIEKVLEELKKGSSRREAERKVGWWLS